MSLSVSQNAPKNAQPISKVKRVLPNAQTASPEFQNYIKKLKPVSLPSVEEKLQGVVDELVKTNNLFCKPKVVISPYLSSLSAFAKPIGGKEVVQVSLGTLKQAKSFDQIAFILGHELNHHQNKVGRFFNWEVRFPYITAAIAVVLGTYACYLYNQRQDKKKLNNRFEPLESLTVAFLGVLGFDAGYKINKYRGAKRELTADRESIRYLQKAGYGSSYKEAFSIPDLIIEKGGEQFMTRKEILKSRWAGYLAHPSFKKRIAALDAYKVNHPDPEHPRQMITSKKWKKLQSDISPVFEQLELERSTAVLKQFHLSPKKLARILK